MAVDELRLLYDVGEYDFDFANIGNAVSVICVLGKGSNQTDVSSSGGSPLPSTRIFGRHDRLSALGRAVEQAISLVETVVRPAKLRHIRLAEVYPVAYSTGETIRDSRVERQEVRNLQRSEGKLVIEISVYHIIVLV